VSITQAAAHYDRRGRSGHHLPGDFTLGDELDMAHRRLISQARRGTADLELAERIGIIFDAK
jgi:hypothetical protein